MIAARSFSGFALTVVTIWFALAQAAAGEKPWATSSNPRFGTTADYPADVFTAQDPPPENGDGTTFRTADGRAQLAIYGAYNVDNDTPASYLAKYEELSSAAYKRVTTEFYAVSGTTGADIYYDRCNFPPHNDDILNCIHVVYPARERAFFDPIVTRISKSLRSG
jgi:hypothetical protein